MAAGAAPVPGIGLRAAPGEGVAERLGLTLDWRLGLAAVAAVAAFSAWREAGLVALPEELLFRGAVQGELQARGLGGWAVIGAAALFALGHVALGGGLPGLLTFFPGCLFGWLRLRSRSVWPAVAAHALANVLWLAR